MVTVTWEALWTGWEHHSRSFHGLDAWERATRFAYELGLSSRTLHIRIES